MLLKLVVPILLFSTVSTDEEEDAEYKDIKHVVNLNIYSYVHHGEDYTCSGSIISKSWILTAAHCIVYKKGDAEEVEVYHHAYGATRLSSILRKNMKPHPRFTPYKPDVLLDIALLRTSRVIHFGTHEYISPIKLARWSPNVGDPVTISGYGSATIGSCCKKSLCTDETAFGEFEDGDSGQPLVDINDELVGLMSAECGSQGFYVNIVTNMKWIRSVTK